MFTVFVKYVTFKGPCSFTYKIRAQRNLVFRTLVKFVLMEMQLSLQSMSYFKASARVLTKSVLREI